MTDQLTLDEAAVAAERGMTLAADNAGQEWAESASSWLRGFLVAHDAYNPDDAWRYGCPEPPTDRRAMGAVIKRAVRLGWMTRDGWGPRASGNLSPGPKYRSLLWHGLA